MLEATEIRRALDRLHDRLARGQLLVLVGAGVSRWAGLPSWRDAVAALGADLEPVLRARVPAARERFHAPAPGAPVPVETLVRVAEAYRLLLGEERLVRRLRELFDTSQADPARLPLHGLLVRLARFVPAFYTTNFDDLLEKALAHAGRSCQVVADAADLHRWRFDEVDGCFVPRFPVYKLHGSLDRPGTLVLSESDFQRRSDLATNPIDLRFCSDVVGREVLLVGYGFNDPNMRWLWTKLRDLRVLPVAWFLEIGASSDLEQAMFEQDRILRVDLHARDARRPSELLDFVRALVERCERSLRPRMREVAVGAEGPGAAP